MVVHLHTLASEILFKTFFPSSSRLNRVVVLSVSSRMRFRLDRSIAIPITVSLLFLTFSRFRELVTMYL